MYLEPEYFAFIRRVGEYGKENYTLMESFKSWLRLNGYLKKTPTIYAIARDDVKATDKNHCRYDVGMIVDENFHNSDLEVEKLDGGKYLLFKIDHTKEAVFVFWANLLSTVKNEGFSMDNQRFILERYSHELISQNKCEICIPILNLQSKINNTEI